MGKLAKKIQNKSIRKFFSSDSYDRNLELMKLLVSHKRFQKIIADARKRLKIPAGGMDDSDKSIEKWYNWLCDETDQVLTSEEFNEQGKQIRQMLKDKTISHKEAQELGQKLDDTTPLNYFSKEPIKIAKQFNVPIHFKEAIQQYILTGKIDAPQHNYSGAEWQSGELPWDAGYIPLKVYTRLTTDEWDEFKNYVDNLAKQWLPKHGRIPKIDEYIEVEKVYDDREKESSADGEKYLMSSEEISDTVYGTPAQNDRVRDMLRKLENLRKQRLIPPKRGPKRGKK